MVPFGTSSSPSINMMNRCRGLEMESVDESSTLVVEPKTFNNAPAHCTQQPSPGPLHSMASAASSLLHAPKRKVSFASLIQIRPILHYNEYSYQEIQGSWYAKKDLKEMKKESRLEARQFDFEKRSSAASSTLRKVSCSHFIRGSECRTHDGADYKRTIREEARNAVFSTQQRHKYHYSREAEVEISKAYMNIGERAIANARIVGRNDAATSRRNQKREEEQQELRQAMEVVDDSSCGIEMELDGDHHYSSPNYTIGKENGPPRTESVSSVFPMAVSVGERGPYSQQLPSKEDYSLFGRASSSPYNSGYRTPFAMLLSMTA